MNETSDDIWDESVMMVLPAVRVADAGTLEMDDFRPRGH